MTITEEDCGTIQGLEISALKEGEDVIEPLKERILGTVASEDVFDPHELDEDGDPKLLVQSGKLIDEELSIQIDEASIERVLARGCWTPVERFGIGEGFAAGGLGHVHAHAAFRILLHLQLER